MSADPFNRCLVFVGLVASLACMPVLAAGSASQTSTAAMAEFEREVSRLEAEYATRQEALQQEMESRYAALGVQIAALKAAGTALPVDESPPMSATAAPALDLDIGGDFRLRYEHTTSHAGSPARDRGVLRGRLAAAWTVNDRFTVGGRITTGDPDDPNSADVTMGEFVDDLALSLDQAYASYRFDDVEIVGGKFTNPFANTELVWDGDVSPFGVAAGHTLHRGAGTSFRIAGIYSIVDEQIVAQSSDMLGVQVSLSVESADNWDIGLSAAYYDYDIGSLLAADSGDIRDNNLAPGGSAYLSDFDLLDFGVTLDYAGFPGGWPLQIVGDYVRNLGAAVPQDSGWSLDFLFGELAEVGHWRFGYGYAVAETDAVLAAFSQDNTTYATNYREHTVTADYLMFDDTHLNLTAYLYRRNDVTLADQPGNKEWISRLRLNLQFWF